MDKAQITEGDGEDETGNEGDGDEGADKVEDKDKGGNEKAATTEQEVDPSEPLTPSSGVSGGNFRTPSTKSKSKEMDAVLSKTNLGKSILDMAFKLTPRRPEEEEKKVETIDALSSRLPTIPSPSLPDKSLEKIVLDASKNQEQER